MRAFLQTDRPTYRCTNTHPYSDTHRPHSGHEASHRYTPHKHTYCSNIETHTQTQTHTHLPTYIHPHGDNTTNRHTLHKCSNMYTQTHTHTYTHTHTTHTGTHTHRQTHTYTHHTPHKNLHLLTHHTTTPQIHTCTKTKKKHSRKIAQTLKQEHHTPHNHTDTPHTHQHTHNTHTHHIQRTRTYTHTYAPTHHKHKHCTNDQTVRSMSHQHFFNFVSFLTHEQENQNSTV